MEKGNNPCEITVEELLELGEMKIGAIIDTKGLEAREIIKGYFFDSSQKLPWGSKKMTLKKAAKKSGKDYKLPGPLHAINRLPDKKK
ncbi:MAG: hypothetical protein WC608_00960 [Parcubacteria group bacterium]